MGNLTGQFAVACPSIRSLAVNHISSVGPILGLACFIPLLTSSDVQPVGAQTRRVGASAREGLSQDERTPAVRGRYLGQRPPGDAPVVFAPGLITSANINHSAPAFSPDGKEVYWSRVLKDSSRVRILYMRLIEGQWTQPRIVPFSSNADDDCPVFSPDGKTLFFVSHRPIDGSGTDAKENIWYVQKQDSGWSAARPVGAAVNKMNLHWQVSVSSAQTLYFSCSQDNTPRIYRSRFIDGAYAKPAVLPHPIDSGSGEETPYVAPDESYVIFSSQRKGGYGGADLYISFRNKQGEWIEPMNLGSKVNSRSYELLPCVSPDRKYLFFASARGGEYDIYWVGAQVIERLREQLDVTNGDRVPNATSQPHSAPSAVQGASRTHLLPDSVPDRLCQPANAQLRERVVHCQRTKTNDARERDGPLPHGRGFDRCRRMLHTAMGN